MMNRVNIVSAQYASKLVRLAYPFKELVVKKSHVHKYGSHIRLIEPKTGKRFHIKFARDTFKKFGLFFPDYAGEEGESIDKSVVDELDDNDIIFFARPEAINKIFVGDLKEKAYLRMNDSEGVETYSIALSELSDL